MRILYPTGLYLNKIPSQLESGSVTWTISTEKPSRPTTVLQQYPSALQLTSYRVEGSDNVDFRKLYGDLLVTSTRSKTSASRSNAIKFEVGYVLGQEDIETISADILLIPRDVDIQHNNNVFDLKLLGLSDDEIELVNTTSASKLNEIRTNMADIIELLDNTHNKIIETKKQISESENSIKAISLTALNDIKEILEAKRDELIINLEILEASEVELKAQVVELRDQLLTMSVLVR